jgi:hypothetical protein
VDKYFQLWNFTSGNLVGEWATADEVLEALGRAYEKAGMELTDDYGLLKVDGEDESVYAEGQELIDLVKSHKHSVSR